MARSCNLSELRAKKAKIIDVFEIKRSRESQVKTRKSQGTTTEQVKVNTTVKSRVSDKVKESTKSRNQVKQQNEKQATKGRNQGQVKIKFCPLHSIARDVIKDFTTIIQCVKDKSWIRISTVKLRKSRIVKHNILVKTRKQPSRRSMGNTLSLETSSKISQPSFNVSSLAIAKPNHLQRVL
ncbi:hypothetical protein P692DRAFT_201811706 [Suillus brevipes Sb2]|nr:hypothetical protein P692DRAFT_201811706 [Suillus brevipes Sb2]